MFVLTEAEKIAILAGCIALLCSVTLLTVCFVCPLCCFYRMMNRRKEKEITKTHNFHTDAEMNLFRDYFPQNFLDNEPPPPYSPSNRLSFLDRQSSLNIGRTLTPKNSVSTLGSDSDSVTGIPLPIMSDADIPETEIPDNSSYEPGNVSITLQFKRITGEDKRVFSQLRVDIKEASDLPLRAYGGKCDPYFTISLHDKNVSKKKQRKSSLPVHEFHTAIVKKTERPVYNESFFFPLEPYQLKKGLLKIKAWDQDKWANDTLVGEVQFKLNNFASCLLEEPSKELDVILKLEDSKLINGQLLLGLCYLPTAERMTVAVLKASNLKAANEKNGITDLYVQALAIYGGKVFERRKTSSRDISSHPVFNEMLMFDVPMSKRDQVVLLLSIRSCENKDAPSITEIQPKPKDPYIGKVIIGSYSRKNSLNHWNAMRNSPRRQVIQWHELR